MKLLLHVCCGPCSAGMIERLIADYGKENVALFFYNPNIWPLEEHERRRENAEKIARQFEVGLICPIRSENDWKIEHENWKYKVRGLEKEKEGGARCAVCYAHRLQEAAKFAKKNGFEAFATTLGMGPMKPLEKINLLGTEIGKQEGVEFLSKNFRKKGGHNRGLELAKELELYRQNYCGCEYSIQ